MKCFNHPGRDAVATCNTCGKALCKECATLFDPPTCRSCAESYVSEIRGEMIKNIVISVVLMLVGIFVIGDVSGVLLAGIPYGWSILNKIQPSMFLWLSWIGWLVYFLIKLVLAYLIGLIALPIKFFLWIRELRRVGGLLKSAT